MDDHIGMDGESVMIEDGGEIEYADADSAYQLSADQSQHGHVSGHAHHEGAGGGFQLQEEHVVVTGDDVVDGGQVVVATDADGGFHHQVVYQQPHEVFEQEEEAAAAAAVAVAEGVTFQEVSAAGDFQLQQAEHSLDNGNIEFQLKDTAIPEEEFNWDRVDRLKMAIQAVEVDEIPCRRASKLFNLPESTVRRHLKDPDIKVNRPGRAPALPQEVEQSIMKHAADMSDLGHSYNTREFLELIAEVQQYLFPEESAFKDDLPHRSYLKRFMTRCPELTVRKRCVVPTTGRILSRNESMANYYYRLEELLNDNDVKDNPDHIFIMEESVICHGDSTQGEVLFPPAARMSLDDDEDEDREMTTVVGCGSAHGNPIPPFIVYKGFKKKNELLDGAYPGTDSVVSPNGLMNSDTMVKFLYHADTYFPSERPVLLLYNGQSTHIFSQIIHVARQMGIVLFVMPPFATNSQMSSDMNYFLSLKGSWPEAWTSYMKKYGAHMVCRGNLAKIVAEAYPRAMTSTNLRTSFRTMGILPYAPPITPRPYTRPVMVRPSDPHKSYYRCRETLMPQCHGCALHCPRPMKLEPLAFTFGARPAPVPRQPKQPKLGAAAQTTVMTSAAAAATPGVSGRKRGVGVRPGVLGRHSQQTTAAAAVTAAAVAAAAANTNTANMGGTVCEICLQSWDESGPGQTWIGCDRCDRWHHLTCIASNKRPRDFENDTFLCRHCEQDSAQQNAVDIPLM